MRSIFIIMYICITTFCLAQETELELDLSLPKHIFFARGSIGFKWQILDKTPTQIRKAGIRSVYDSANNILEVYDKNGNIILRRVDSHSPMISQEFFYDKRDRLVKFTEFESGRFCGGIMESNEEKSYTYNFLGKVKKITWKGKSEYNTKATIKYNWRLKPFIVIDSVFNESKSLSSKTVYQYNLKGELRSSYFLNDEPYKIPARIKRDADYYKLLIDDSFYMRKACTDEQWDKYYNWCSLKESYWDWFEEQQYKLLDDAHFVYGLDYKRNRLIKAQVFKLSIFSTDSFVYEKSKLKKWIFRCERCYEGPEVIYDFEYYKNGKIWKITSKNAIIEFDKKGFPVKQDLFYEGKIYKTATYKYEYY